MSNKLVAIGDIHGCYDTMIALIDKVKTEYPDDNLKFVFLGDYIDRGPKSSKVIEYLIEHPEHIALLGNHEDMVLDVLMNPQYEENWYTRNGGKQTLNSYSEYGRKIPEAHIEWMKKLNVMAIYKKWVFVHAGIDPTIADLDAQIKSHCMWSRQWNGAHSYAGGWKVVHGHTPLVNGIPDENGDQFNIDTACVYGYYLTAMVIDRETDEYEFIQQEKLD